MKTVEDYVNELNKQKLQNKQYILPINEQIKNELNNQQNMCYICCGELSFNEDDSTEDDVVLKTNCNHYFHYNCLIQSIKSKSTYYSHSRQECPYCRSQMGWFPKLTENQQLLKYVHKEFYAYLYNKPNATCQAIVKSGKKKGLLCGCKIKIVGSLVCGKHKNYKFPKPKEETLNKDVSVISQELTKYKNSWFLGKLLKCY